MNRIEKVREVVDSILLSMADNEERRCAYVHLYGVAQAAALIAGKRKENIELSIIAGMLHDIYSYKNMNTIDHAHKGAALAKELLDELNIFLYEEIDLICSAVYHHSDKESVHEPFAEILKDADVMQYALYNPIFENSFQEPKRFNSLKKEFGMI